MPRACWMRLVAVPVVDGCVACGKPLPPMTVGAWVGALISGNELVGVIGPCCLSRCALERLGQLNETDGVPR